MYSVTQRIKSIKQPRGGYVKPRDFEVIELDDGIKLFEEESIHAALVGLVVDYLTRFSLGTPVKKAFSISLVGADLIGESINAKKLLDEITGLDDKSIFNACKLVGYDACYRAGKDTYKPVENIEADEKTILNIRRMVNRSIEFFNIFGPVTVDSPIFIGGYTDIVSRGDGDFLTKDTVWDFKVSKKAPTAAHTLQILMYYLMGKRSIEKAFETVKNIGIFNPRLSKVYLYNVNKIPQETIDIVSKEVIGYK